MGRQHQCRLCFREIGETDGCNVASFGWPGEDGQRRAWRRIPNSTGAICPDCGASPGNYHHFPCSEELCPGCGGKFTTCSCSPGERTEPALVSEAMASETSCWAILVGPDGGKRSVLLQFGLSLQDTHFGIAIDCLDIRQPDSVLSLHIPTDQVAAFSNALAAMVAEVNRRETDLP